MRAAPGGTIGGLMMGAAWFDWDDEDDTKTLSRLAAYDPLHDLSYAAYLQGEAQDAMAAATRPVLEREQFQVDFTRWSAKGREPSTPTARQLETAHQLAKDLLVHAVDSLSRGTIQDYDWIDQLPIFDDLVTAFASHDMEVMRAGFTPFGVNDFGSGQKDGQSATASGGGAIVSSSVPSPTVSDLPVARPHGEIQPLRLAPPQFGNGSSIGSNSSLSLITTMSGGSGGSGGGDAPIAVSDYYASLHDEVLTVSSANGVLWNDYLGGGASVSNVSTPSDGAFNYFSADGAFEYDPPANWKGTATFSYSISNAYGTSDPVTSYITITNTAPATGADTYAAITNTELEIPSSRWPLYDGLLANDTDGDGDSISVSDYTQPQHGSITVEPDGSFTYLPETNYAGQDTFTYQITDGVDESANQTVTIQVSQPLVDLDTDSDNNGNIEGSAAEDLIETTFPGKIVARNSDNDNDNNQLDLDDIPMTAGAENDPYPDDDLVPLAISVETAIPQTNGFTFTVEVSSNLRLWEERTKDTAILNGHTYTVGIDELPSSQYPLFVEGYSVGSGTITGTLKNNAGVQVNQDSVSFLVVEMDIDTDSDNDNVLERSIAEELIECLPGDDVGEVGKRIFKNVDDDNKNGRADLLDSKDDYDLHGLKDKDFAEVKLSALGVSGLEGYSLWLGFPPISLNAWDDKDKSYLSSDRYDIDFGTPGSGDGPVGWRIWDIGPNGAVSFPETLYFEGKTEGQFEIDWRLVKPNGSGFDASGDILARDEIEVNVEPIVWPNQDPSAPWDPDEFTVEWNGFQLPDGWFIQSSLGDIINGTTGYIRTQYPQKVEYSNENPDFHWEGTIAQKTNATLDLAELCATSNWGDDIWMKVEVEYEFEQSPNISVGQFVDTNLPDRWQASFHHNSGVIFENRSEIQIFDTASLLTAIDGTDITLDGEVVSVEGDPTVINAAQNSSIQVQLTRVNGGGSDSQTRDADEIHSLITGIPYGYQNLDYETDETNMERLDRAPKGSHTMKIYVRKHEGSYEFKVSIPGHSDNVQYSVPILGDADPNALYLQSHWGSGVKFKTAKVVQEDPPTSP
jgi:hypothetical protein